MKSLMSSLATGQKKLQEFQASAQQGLSGFTAATNKIAGNLQPKNATPGADDRTPAVDKCYGSPRRPLARGVRWQNRKKGFKSIDTV